MVQYSWYRNGDENIHKMFSSPPHRVGRVLSFFSSRRNWDSPNPSPAGECVPPLLGGGANSLAREGLGESQFRRGDIHCGTLYIYVLCDHHHQTEAVGRTCLAVLYSTEEFPSMWLLFSKQYDKNVQDTRYDYINTSGKCRKILWFLIKNVVKTFEIDFFV